MSEYTICLAGNPNVGKSTVFNNLTGMHQHTGNWAGKTVENAKGEYIYNENKYYLIDIPGTYSIMAYSEEEEIARNYLCFSNPDCVVIVVDATCLERNLNLVFQILELTNNVVLCVNLMDEASKKGIKINLKVLEQELGIPVVGTIAQKKSSLKNLSKVIEEICTKGNNLKPINVKYSKAVEGAILEIEKIIKNEINDEKISRWVSIKIIDSNEKILQAIFNNLGIDVRKKEIQDKLKIAKEILKKENISEKNFTDRIVETNLKRSENICNKVVKVKNINYNERDRKIDKIVTSKIWGIPIMLVLLGIIFWITIVGANYPSNLLSHFFTMLEEKLTLLFSDLKMPYWITGIFIEGMFRTASWVISVMLPPMLIFFPLFAILEDLGYLPRIAFNLDNFFRKVGTSGKQALTMCMGFGCNAVGVTGCRIIDSPREKILAMITNAFVPCNGRYPLLITISSIFIGSIFIGSLGSIFSAITVLIVILLGIFMTLLISKILSKTILKGKKSTFVLELPNYRKPQVFKVIIRSICDKIIFILGRAIIVAAPAGIVIWLFANIHIGNLSILNYIANFLDPLGRIMGVDGYILTSFILGMPANEIVLPILLMSYMSNGSLIEIDNIRSISEILKQNGWSILTAINVMIICLMHFPCSTTLLTIKKESKSWKYTFLAFFLPTICGVLLCIFTTFIFKIFF